MSSCLFFAKNRKKEEFMNLIHNDFSQCLSFECRTKDYINHECPYFKECVKLSGETLKTYKPANCIINKFGEDKYELIYYHKDFQVTDEVVNMNVDTSRKFIEVGEYLIPQKPADVDDFNDSMEKNRRRATDKYFGFAYCNAWTHFFTFTFSPYLVDNRYDGEQTSYYWKLTRQTLQRFDPDVKILCVPEYHSDGAIHFHSLVGFSRKLYYQDFKIKEWMPTFQKKSKSGKVLEEGFCIFDKEGRLTYKPKCKHKYFLIPYYQYGKQLTTKLGQKLYVTNFYEYGINSCAILPEGDNYAAVNYLVNYTDQSESMGYGRKRYFRTQNLDYKGKEVLHIDDPQIYEEFAVEKGMKVYKENDRMVVMRNFSVKEEGEENDRVKNIPSISLNTIYSQNDTNNEL